MESMSAKKQGGYYLRRNRVRCSLNDVQVAILDRMVNSGFWGFSRSDAIERILDRELQGQSELMDSADLARIRMGAARHPRLIS